ncbi:MAG: 16S rRNA (guanine(527)-N(7))-methyltransferase RsmG [Atopobiaceae bacterium]|nr:16S rRNA (guanine(527)-N(7))-methyltransferase RsmG [Atopobiaceae bacterium]
MGKVRQLATREQWKTLVRHLELVVERNRTLNLTRITGWDEAVCLHIVDSLLLQDAFAAAPAGAFVDVGTGAGYPGIPLAIVTGRKGTLVDSVGKKAAAVREFVHELGLEKQLRVESTRIEELAKRERGRYAVVTARAVAQTGVLVEYAAPLLRKGGRLVVAKARPTEDELLNGDRVAKLCGMRRVSRETYELPCDMGHREVISYERVGNPSIRLPRATGMAQHHPL